MPWEPFLLVCFKLLIVLFFILIRPDLVGEHANFFSLVHVYELLGAKNLPYDPVFIDVVKEYGWVPTFSDYGRYLSINLFTAPLFFLHERREHDRLAAVIIQSIWDWVNNSRIRKLLLLLEVRSIDILQELAKDALLVDNLEVFTVMPDISGITYIFFFCWNQIDKRDLQLSIFFNFSCNFLKVIATLSVPLKE